MSENVINQLSRNQEQEKLFFIIYQSLFYIRMNKEFDLVSIIEETMDADFSDVSIFVKETAVKVLSHYDEIRRDIEPNCIKWEYDRINLVLISILMLGIGEYRYVGGVDKAIIVDVCVKLAKKYADEKDYRFINAVLDKIL